MSGGTRVKVVLMAIRILVVDADPTVQRALGQALSQAGYEVLASSEGLEALRSARSDKPALVLDVRHGEGLIQPVE